MDDTARTRLRADIEELGRPAIVDGDVEPAEMQAALDAADRGDEGEARGFFLLLLVREGERYGI